MAPGRNPTAAELNANIAEFFGVLNNESDFVALIVSTGVLEAALNSLLERVFRPDSKTALQLLDGQGGALGDVHSKAQVAYCLGLISKADFRVLSVIGRMRNAVAHHHQKKQLSDPEIQKICLQLDPATMPFGDAMPTEVQEILSKDMRFRLHYFVLQIHARLLHAAEHAKYVPQLKE